MLIGKTGISQGIPDAQSMLSKVTNPSVNCCQKQNNFCCNKKENSHSHHVNPHNQNKGSCCNKNNNLSQGNSIFDQISDLLKKLSRQAAKDLQTASGGRNPYDTLKANRSLSNYYLNNQLISKTIGKLSRLMDRMTNLQ